MILPNRVWTYIVGFKLNIEILCFYPQENDFLETHKKNESTT